MSEENKQITTSANQTLAAPAKSVPWSQLTVQSIRPQLEKVLPKNMDVNFYCQSLQATLAIQQEKYQNCDKLKLFYAIQRCAEFGVVPDGRKAVINPYGKDAKLILMFGAFVDKMDEAGYRVQAEQVYSEDQFTELAGDNPGIHHKINRFKPRGSYVGTYIILRAKKDGQVAVREFVSSDEMAKIRGCAQTDNVWQKWFDEKCKAAAIKRAAKRLSLSPEFEKMIDFDNEDNDPTGMKNITGSAFSSDPQDPKESSKLAAALNLKKGSEIEIPESTNKENLTVEETSKKEADEIFG